MSLQYVFAFVLLFGVGAIFLLFLIAGRGEMRRRAALPEQERKALEEADAKWPQDYGF